MDLDHIKVTHFVNPQLFWFTIEPSETDIKFVHSLEEIIKEFLKDYPQVNHTPYDNGEFVAVYYMPMKKYVRGVVEQLMSDYENNYMVWLMDYGIPVLTVRSVLHRLPADFCIPINHIRRGGIANIVPLTKELNDSLQPVFKVADNWCERTIRTFKELLNDYQDVLYINKHFKQKKNGHIWFELLLGAKTEKQLNAADKLIELELGKHVDTLPFMSMCASLKSLQQVPWTNVDGTINYTVNELVKYDAVLPNDIQDEPYWDNFESTVNKKVEISQNIDDDNVCELYNNRRMLLSETVKLPEDADFNMDNNLMKYCDDVEIVKKKKLGYAEDSNVGEAAQASLPFDDIVWETKTISLDQEAILSNKVQGETENDTCDDEKSCMSFATAKTSTLEKRSDNHRKN